MTITTITISGSDYISYASVLEADTRLLVDPRRGVSWADLNVDEKGANLVAATNRLDLMAWQGAKTGGVEQKNDWPRTGMRHCDGTPTSTTEVPYDVANATIIQAGSITLDPSTADAGSSGSNVKKVSAGSANVTFFTLKKGPNLQDETVYILIKCYLESYVSGVGAGAFASGTSKEDATSSFTKGENFKLTKGFS